MRKFSLNKNAQTAVEYLLLLAVVVSIVLVGLRTYLPRVYVASNEYFDKASKGIAGKPHPCGDGCCDADFETSVNCPVDCPGTLCP